MNKKKLLTIAMVLSMVAILAIGGTIAYFTDTEAAKNVFTVGDIDVVLNEVFDDTTPLLPTEDPENYYVQKEVTVENVGNSDAYVRVFFAYEDTKDVGAMAWLGFNGYCPNGPVKTDCEDQYVIPGGNGDWLQITDGETVYTVGYVTLSEPVAVGDETDPILTALAIKAGADNAWKEIVGEQYDLMVLVQSAQVVDDKSATDSLNTAFGFAPTADQDAKIAKMFTDATGVEYSVHNYTSEGAWTAKDAWASYEREDNSMVEDAEGTITIVNVGNEA